MSGNVPQAHPTPSQQEAFEGYFDQRGYLTMYYPALMGVKELATIVKKHSRRLPILSRIPIANIATRSGLSHEVVENLFIIDFTRSVARELMNAYPSGDALVLDVAGGPTIYQHMVVSFAARKIIHSEFSTGGREEVAAWLRNDPHAYNWDSYFDLLRTLLLKDKKFMGLLRQLRKSKSQGSARRAKLIKKVLTAPTADEFKQHVRERVSNNVVFGDVFRNDLGLKKKVTQADIVTAHFSVESATDCKEVWEKGMDNIFGVVTPGGYIILTAIQDAEWYYIHTTRMPAVKITGKDMLALCKKNGFRVLQETYLDGSDKEKSGYGGMLFLFAKKEL